MSTQHPSVDVAFVGGGISSLLAAWQLAEVGKRVAVYETVPRAKLGGQCRDAFGGMFFVDTPEQRIIGLKDSQELAWEDWQGYAEFGPEDTTRQWWARHYIERCVPDVRDWMVGQGLRFFPVANWAERAHEGTGNRLPRFHLLWGCGPALVRRAVDGLAPHEGGRAQVHCGHQVERLITDGDRVVGFEGTADGESFSVRAEHVVVGAGGRTGNLTKVRESWPREEWSEPPADLLCGVWREMDGAMHDEAARVGGRLAGLGNMWVYAAGVTHWKGDYDGHGLALIPSKSSLWMRSDGRRFDPPLLAGYDTREAVSRICAQEHQWSWMLTNRKILERELTIQGARFNPGFAEKKPQLIARDLTMGARAQAQEFLDRCPDALSAPDLTTLVARMQALTPDAPIDVEGLRADVARYDAEIARGGRLYSDPQLVALRSVRAFLNDAMRTSKFRAIDDGHGGDLVAVRLRPVVRKTLGGIVTDQQCRVLGDSGAPVEGLYAIGESAGFGGGGMNGKRTLEGTLMGGCVLTARDLARHLASA